MESCRRENPLPAPLLLDLSRIAVPGVFPILPPSAGFPEEHPGAAPAPPHATDMLWRDIPKGIKLSRGMEGQKPALLTDGPLLPGLPTTPG